MARAGDLDIVVAMLAEGGSVVRVDGELDLSTQQRFEEAVESAAPGERLVVDLTACTFLDSSALRALISAAHSAQAAGGAFSLVASDPGILRILEIAAVDTVLSVHSSLDSALGINS